MSATGAGDQSAVNSVSTEAFVTAFVTNTIVFVVEIGVFVLLFRFVPVIYEPRTYLPPIASLRAPKLPKSLWKWALAIYDAPRERIIQTNGLDAYMFLQYLYMNVKIFVPMWILSWLILLPMNSVRSGGTQRGLYRFTFGNIGMENQSRYYTHLVFAYGFTIWILYLTKKEMANFIKLRQRFLSSPEHTKLAQSKTVLVTGLPPEYRSETALSKLADYMPGGASRIWLARNLGSHMVDLYNRQTNAASKLEAGETKLLKRAIKIHNKAEKASAKREANTNSKHTKDDQRPLARKPQHTYDPERQGSITDQLVPRRDRPTFRKGPIPFFGTKTDTIDWAKAEIVETSQKLEAERGKLGQKPADSAAFIQFDTQIAAHIFQQSTVHHLPLRMADRYIEVAPEDVIFGNLGINPYQAKIRYALSWAATLGLLIGWSPVVAFVGLLSNVNQLCAKAPWLRWLCELPPPINGIIQGVLPPVALALLFMTLPIVLRLLATFEGIPLRTKVELSLMNRYFLFLVIYGLLIVTIASGLTSALPKIAENPGSTVTLLAQNLPNASNFYISYLITTGLSGAGGAFVSIITLILHYIFLFLLASTPRKTHKVKYNMQSAQWGTLFPNMTLLSVIGLTYSVISPLTNGFAAVTFALFAFCYKYLWTWVYDFPPASETSGLFFPIAITHTYVGLYIMQVCLTGLFFLARNEAMEVSALPEGIMMIILIVFTALYQILLTTSYSPLIKNLPLDLGIQIDDDDAQRLTAAQKNDRLAAKLKLDKVGLDKVVDGTDKIRQNVTDFAQELRPRELFNKRLRKGTVDEKNEEAYPMQRFDQPHAENGHTFHSQEQKRSSQMRKTDAEKEGREVSEHAFDHPAAWQPMKPIWLPEDPFGISVFEVDQIRALGIECTTSGARLNEKAQCRISRPPPEVDFESEGLDRMPTYRTQESFTDVRKSASNHGMLAAKGRDSENVANTNGSSEVSEGSTRQAVEGQEGVTATDFATQVDQREGEGERSEGPANAQETRNAASQ